MSESKETEPGCGWMLLFGLLLFAMGKHRVLDGPRCLLPRTDRQHGGAQSVRRVILESPYAGEIEANVAYARACLRDCLERGEAPIASHLLYTQPGVLRDDVPEEREWGIGAGLAWVRFAAAGVFYVDRGWSRGMKMARSRYEECSIAVEERTLPGYRAAADDPSGRYVVCECGADVDTDSRSQCDACGRLVLP